MISLQLYFEFIAAYKSSLVELGIEDKIIALQHSSYGLS